MSDPFFTFTSINPFGLINVDGYASPTFADIDGDNDLDAFIGGHKLGEFLGQQTLFFENTGTATNPAFVFNRAMPFDEAGHPTPTFVDIDDDGDLDAVVGYGVAVFLYRNTGTISNPMFTGRDPELFGWGAVWGFARPTFGDIDGDGDYDAYVGNQLGQIIFFRNTGTVSSPVFADSSFDPYGLNSSELGGYNRASPTLVDIDDDGDLDAVVGNTDGDIMLNRNKGTDSSPDFSTLSNNIWNPFGLSNVGEWASPSFADIDGDGDLDAFVGNKNGDIVFFTNHTSTANVSVPSTPLNIANEIFMSELGPDEKQVAGAEQVGMIRVMADLSKAAYHLEDREDKVINDFSDFAEDALIEVLAQDWQPVDLGPLVDDDPIFLYINHQSLLNDFTAVRLQDGMSNGFYTNGNTAAYVVRSDDAIVLSFRGTNDNGNHNPNDSGNHVYPDRDDWSPIDIGGDPGGGKAEHYEYLLPLISALDNYILDRSNGINKVYVTGHSLGGAMATHYMETHKNIKVNSNDSKSDDLVTYSAVTFAAPSYGLGFGKDPRITHIEIQGDPVPDAGVHPGRTIRFEGNDTKGFDPLSLDLLPSDAANHSMDYYRQITKSIDAIAWLKILETQGEPNVLLGADKIEISENQTHDTFIVDGLNSDNNKVFNNGDDKLWDVAAGTYDFFYGGRGSDEIDGGIDNDFIYGGAGNDDIDGLFGIDTAYYVSEHSNYKIEENNRLLLGDQLIVTDLRQNQYNDGIDTLENIERLIFTDLGVAFDLDGNAGEVAKILGAIFGASSVSNKQFVGTGLKLLDNGMNPHDATKLALNLKLGDGFSNADEVNLLYQNLLGILPPTEDFNFWVGKLDSGGLSQVSLAELAINSSLNESNIDLVGLQQTGIEFV